MAGDPGLANISLKPILSLVSSFDVSGYILARMTDVDLAEIDVCGYTCLTSRILNPTAGLAFLANIPFAYFADEELIVGESQWLNAYRPSALVM